MHTYAKQLRSLFRIGRNGFGGSRPDVNFSIQIQRRIQRLPWMAERCLMTVGSRSVGSSQEVHCGVRGRTLLPLSAQILQGEVFFQQFGLRVVS